MRSQYSEQLLEVLDLLVDVGVDMEVKNTFGETALNQSAAKGLTESVRFLSDHQADINAPNRIGQTPLHRAVESGSVDTVVLLIKKGANVDAVNAEGLTPLALAEKSNRSGVDSEMIRFLGDEDECGRRSTYTTLEYNEGDGDNSTENFTRTAAAEVDLTSFSANDDQGSLPAGWESAVDATGRMFYIDHNSMQTTFERPKIQEISLEDDLMADLMDSLSDSISGSISTESIKPAPVKAPVTPTAGPNSPGATRAVSARRLRRDRMAASVKMTPSFSVQDLEAPTSAAFQVTEPDLQKCRQIIEQGEKAFVVPHSMLKFISLEKLAEDARARQALTFSREEEAIAGQLRDDILLPHDGWTRELGSASAVSDRGLVRPRTFFKYFFYHSPHYNYVGRVNRARTSEKFEPLIVSVVRDIKSDTTPDQPLLRVYVWLRTGDEHYFAPWSEKFDKHNWKEGLPGLVEKFVTDKISKSRRGDTVPVQIMLDPVKEKDHLSMANELLKFSNDDPRRATCFSIGLLYSKKGQTHEDQQFNNEHASPGLDRFLDWLGDRIRMKNWKGYRGDLDTKSDATGTHAIFRRWRGLEIMFHVSTMLPFTPGNDQQLHRKRRIGNDIGTIVFQEGGAYEPPIRSQFLHVYWVVSPVEAESAKNESKHRIAVATEYNMKQCSPGVPKGGLFDLDDDFRDFFFAKMLNGLLTAKNHPALRERLWCKPKEHFLVQQVQEKATRKELVRLQLGGLISKE
jgi:Rap/ran-GAP/Ankyrin repeats (3 copies)/WW domain